MSCNNTAASAERPARTEQRVALVIGNSEYKARPLKNPVNDAKLIASALESVGFEVMQGTNLTQREMYRLAENFRARSETADVALIYYAGHGVQIDGENFLIPVELEPENDKDIRDRSVHLDRLLKNLDVVRRRVNIVIIDACRNDPFGMKRSLASQGLAEIPAKLGTLIAYSTSPNSTAADGASPNGRNSVYSYALAAAIQEPDRPVEQAFKDVRRNVLQATRGRQTPWEVTSLTVPFAFNPRSPVAQSPRATAAPVAVAVSTKARSMTPEDDGAIYYQPPEEARQELAKMGVAWTTQAFIDSMSQGDTIAARLFVLGGKDVFALAGNETAIGYLVCGENRAKMLKTLQKLDIDLGRSYERRYRIEGVSLVEKTNIIHEWLSKCPDDDPAFAEAVVSAGVKWEKGEKLRNLKGESWPYRAAYARESVKILIKGRALDPSIDDYALYRQLLDEPRGMATSAAANDPEYISLVAPKERAAFDKRIAEARADKKRAETEWHPPSLVDPQSIYDTMNNADTMKPSATRDGQPER